MTIQCEHFIYAMFNGVGYKLIKSPGISKLVTQKQLVKLQRIGDNLPKPRAIAHWLDTERLVAVTYSRPTWDEYGRLGYFNHTILIPINEYLQLTQPQIILNDFLITSMKEPKEQLEAIQIK